jgi:hypothetical protein
MEVVSFDVIQVQCANKRRRGFIKHSSAKLVAPARMLGAAALGAALGRSGDLDRAQGEVAAMTDGVGRAGRATRMLMASVHAHLRGAMGEAEQQSRQQIEANMASSL